MLLVVVGLFLRSTTQNNGKKFNESKITQTYIERMTTLENQQVSSSENQKIAPTDHNDHNDSDDEYEYEYDGNDIHIILDIKEFDNTNLLAFTDSYSIIVCVCLFLCIILSNDNIQISFWLCV